MGAGTRTVPSDPGIGEGFAPRSEPIAERLRRALYEVADAVVDLVEHDRHAEPPHLIESEPLLLDVRAAARTLGISVTALRRFERSGAIVSVRMGRRLLFRADVVREFAAAHEGLR